MDQERIKAALEGLNGIHLAIGGDVAPTRGRLSVEQYAVGSGDPESVFRSALQQLFTWGQAAGVDVRQLVAKIPATTS